MFTKEQMQLVREEFVKHGWTVTYYNEQYPSAITFKKENDDVGISINFNTTEIYCEVNYEFGTYVDYLDIDIKSAKETYQIVLKSLEDQFSDYMKKYEVDLKKQHEFIVSHIEVTRHETK